MTLAGGCLRCEIKAGAISSHVRPGPFVVGGFRGEIGSSIGFVQVTTQRDCDGQAC